MWSIVLVMASMASALLVIPPEAKAEMIGSRMQSGKALELVRQQLCSEIMQQQIQRYGLSESEAQQIQAVLSDEQVIREMVRLDRQVAHASKTTIRQSMASSLLTALQSSVESHMGTDLRQKLSERATGAFGNERLIASRLSTNGDTVNARKALAQAQRALTAERLVALGMTEEDAVETVAKLKASDIDSIFKEGVQIGYSAGMDLTSGEGLILLVIIVLGIAAAIAGGPVVVVFLVVALLALFYFLTYDEW